MAPPPATIEYALTARLTTMIASLRDLADSSMNCFAPPLSIIVTDLDPVHPVNIFHLSFPI